MDTMQSEQQQTKNELYELISSEQSKEEFEEQLTNIKQEFGELLDDDAAAFLLVDKLGFNTANVVKLNDVHPGQEATVEGIISSIQPAHVFTRKNGRQGKVVNLLLTDESGSLPIVLWNDDAHRVEQGEIKEHLKLKIINGYTKQGRNGAELHVGRWSSLSIEEKNENDHSLIKKQKQQKKELKDALSLKGTILSISPTNVFFRKDETYGFVSKVHLKTKKGIQLVTVWDSQVKNLQDFSKGDTVEFSYLDVKTGHGKKEYHANGKAVIKKT